MTPRGEGMAMGESEDGKVQELPVESYNFANSTKWVFNIPFGRLFNAKYGTQAQ